MDLITEENNPVKINEDKEDNGSKKSSLNSPKEEVNKFMNIVYNKDIEIMLEFFKNNLKKSYNKLPSFFKHSTTFPKSGKQGVLGTLKLGSNEKGGEREIVYKMSQYFNFVIEQENAVMKSLNTIRHYCPHFCRGFGKTTVGITNDFRESETPFDFDKDKYIREDILFMEKIDESRKFYRYIKKQTFDENVLFSIIKQVLMAISIAQQEKKLTHYDLHSNNVMIKKCDLNSCFLYKLDEENVFLVPTYGYYPVIIDFGFSYIGDMEKNPLYGVLAHTKIGFTSDRYDEIADHKLFLNSVSNEFELYRQKTQNIEIFGKIVDKLYEPLTIDRGSGWDENPSFKNASDVVSEILNKENSSSKFFKKYGDYCLDMLQSIITLPLKKKNFDNIKKYYKILVTEFGKIENEISSDFYNLYIFKKMVISAIKLKKKWLRNEEGHLKQFKRDVYEAIDDVSKFCSPKQLNFEKLLCACIATAECIEGVMFDVMEKMMAEKYEEYDKLKVRNVKDVFRIIDDSINSPFVFDRHTKIYIFDCVEKRTTLFKLRNQEEIDDMNDSQGLERGLLLDAIINKDEEDRVENV